MTSLSGMRYRLPRSLPAVAAALAILATLTVGAVWPATTSAQMTMPMGNPMAGPMLGGMFGQSMMPSPSFPASFGGAMPNGGGMPSYLLPAPSYTSTYAAPIATTVVTSGGAYTAAPTSYSPERTYSYSGVYCTDQTGGQVWVPSGGSADGLNCSGATNSPSVPASDGSNSGSGYTP
jgi:hypothetical protein